MMPFRATAHMVNAIVTMDGVIHLDGLLAAAAFWRLPREQRDALPSPDRMENPLDIEIPLARWTAPAPAQCSPHLLDEAGDVWGWRASAAEAAWVAEELRPVRRKVEIGAMGRYGREPGKLNLSLGPLKAWDKPFPARLAEQLVFYGAGDLDAVADLLRDIRFIGKVHNHGAGEVLRWNVEPWAEDWSCERDGRPMRALPATWPGVEGDVEIMSVRAPYWHRARFCLGVRP